PNLADGLPMSLAARQISMTLISLLEGHWDEARLAYLQARRILEEGGHRQLVALLQLAVSQLAADHFSEAAQAAQEAEEYFHDRGADAFIAIYRAHAAKELMAGGRAPHKAS